MLRGRMRHWAWTIRSQIFGLALLPLSFLVLVLVLIAVLRFQSEAASSAVQRADSAIALSSAIAADLTAMQRSTEQYFASRKPADRAAAQRYGARMPQLTQDLQTLSSDNPAQKRLAVSLSRLADQILSIERAFLAAAIADDRTAAAKILSSPKAAAIVRSWQSQSADLIAGEVALRDARWQHLQAVSRVLDWVIGLGAFFGFLITLAAARGLGRRIQSRESQLQKYRLLAKHARDIILFIRRSDGKILEANAAALQTYGYSAEELEALNARDLRAPETLHRLDAELDLAEEVPLAFETVHRRKDGSTFPVEVAAQAVRIDGERLMVSIVRDISERRLAQQELRAALNQAVEGARLKSEFLATMSHEIRTPLNAVIGMTELLLHSNLNEDQRHCAVMAHESGQSLLHLINDILDFSKIEAQRIDLEIIEFRLVAVVEGVAGLFASQAARNRVALMTYVNPRIPQALLGDPGRLRQVLTNLTANAVKFTENGSVVLNADLRRVNEDSVDIHFSVKDTGIGIAPQALSGLFEPFRQADGSMARRFGGTGLGLSISKGLVELMGGSIAVQSAPGQGSTFSFTLTLKCAAQQPQEAPNLGSMRALVLDDDAAAREIFERYLTSWKMRCDTVADPLDACQMIEAANEASDPYDVVLVDLLLPNMDGFEFARNVERIKGISNTRLIMVTAYDEPQKGRAAIEAGFSGYLTKPVRQSQLYDCIVNASHGSLPLAYERAGVAQTARGSRILIAEDNAINREVALRQLGKLGYAAQAVSDGRQAVEAAISGQFDIVLMDCQMPAMDGFEATRAIRKRETHTGDRIRIIAMTANALAHDRQACLDAGMDDYISKPVTLDALARVLSGETGQKQTLDVNRLDEIFEGDRRSISDFLSTALPALLRIVNRLQDHGDLEARLAAAHELKGAAANIGAVEISQTAAQLEQALREGRSDCNALVMQLYEAYERALSGARTLEIEV